MEVLGPPAVARHLFVIGTSAGRMAALQAIIAALPADLNAAVCIVKHLPANTPSHLEAILQRQTVMPVTKAQDGAHLQSGQILVAVTDYHFSIEGNRVRLGLERRENQTRPSIDGLFRTAAQSFGPRVIGVVLTGLLDEGTAGLREIKERGGVTVVQSPAGGECKSLPRCALKHIPIDYTLELHEMAPLLAHLVGTPITAATPPPA